MIAAVLLFGFALCMIAAMVSDVFTQKIPNWLVLSVIAGFVLVLPFSGLSFADIGWHLLIGFITLVFGYTLFSLGVMGAGDSKFMAATALWLGFGAIGEFVVAFGILGGAVCLAMLIAREYLMYEWIISIPWVEDWLCKKAGTVPYGLALGPAGLYAIEKSPIFTAALSAF